MSIIVIMNIINVTNQTASKVAHETAPVFGYKSYINILLMTATKAFTETAPLFLVWRPAHLL